MAHPSTPLSGFARVGIVILTFALGCAVSVGLWILWTGRCNEACPGRTIVGMMCFLALLPTLGTLSAVLLVSMGWPARVKAVVGAGLFVVAAAAAIWLGDMAGTSATAAGLR